MEAIEHYHGGFIAYSPGMFQFESCRPHNVSREGILLSVDLQENSVVREYGVTPLIIDDDFIPCPAAEPMTEDILNFLSGIVVGRRGQAHPGTMV